MAKIDIIVGLHASYREDIRLDATWNTPWEDRSELHYVLLLGQSEIKSWPVPDGDKQVFGPYGGHSDEYKQELADAFVAGKLRAILEKAGE